MNKCVINAIDDLDVAEKFKKGQIVKQNSQTCVVVGLPGDGIPDIVAEKVPSGHVALWYGQTNHNLPQMWIVPADVVEPYDGNWDVFR